MPAFIPVLTFALCLLSPLAQGARPAFEIAGQEIAAGEQRSFALAFGAGEAGIPVTVFHGPRPGPVVTFSAGTHGDEYPSITALQRLRREIDPGELAGTLILVHATSLAALHQRGQSPLHPVDGKNLNREFPGRVDGSPTERLAHFLTQEIVNRSDYLADLHSGSADEWLWPHIYAPFVGDPALDARTLAWAKAAGLRHVVLYGDRPRDPANSISYPNTAMTRGKPGLTLEIGDRGRNEESDIRAYLAALRGLLAGLDMYPGMHEPTSGHVFYERLVGVETPATGLFEPHCAIGELVETGALLGIVRDYFGEPLAELRAPTRGVVLIMQHAPPVTSGAGLITLGVEQEHPAQ